MSDPDKDTHGPETRDMTQSPLALKRRREAERPPGIPSSKKSSNESKDKKNSSSSAVSGLLEYLYLVVGFLWYSLLGLWKKPGEGQYGARITVSKALYTNSEFVVKIQRQQGQSFGTNPPLKVTSQDKTFRGELRNHGQQEVYEILEDVIKREGKESGAKGYFLATRIGYDLLALDPDHLIPSQNW